MEMLLFAIFQKIQKDPEDLVAYRDLLNICRETKKTDIPLAVEYLEKLSDWIEEVIPTIKDIGKMREMFAFHREVVFAGARESFYLYLLALEWNRDPDRKFFPPRRKVLKPLVDDLQDLADGKIDFLGISLPPRVGKSTLCIFFMTWIMGRRPDVANVMSGHSDKLTDGFYRELLAILTDNTQYLWGEIFPNVPIVNTSSKNETIDLDKSKRFPTMFSYEINDFPIVCF